MTVIIHAKSFLQLFIYLNHRAGKCMYLSSTAPHGMSFQLLQKNRLQIGSVDGLQLLSVCIAEKSNGYITVSFLIHRKQKPDWNITVRKIVYVHHEEHVFRITVCPVFIIVVWLLIVRNGSTLVHPNLWASISPVFKMCTAVLFHIQASYYTQLLIPLLNYFPWVIYKVSVSLSVMLSSSYEMCMTYRPISL